MHTQRLLTTLISLDFAFQTELIFELPHFFDLIYILLNILKPCRSIIVSPTPLTTYKISNLDKIPSQQFTSKIETLHNALAIFLHYLKMEDRFKHDIKSLILVLDCFYASNQNNRRILDTDFVNETASFILSMDFIADQYYSKSHNRSSIREPDFIFLEFAWLFSTAAKVDVVQSESKLI